MAGRVVLLNGVGSVGKSSVARALQAIAATPWLHVSMDGFIDMLPPALIGHPDGLTFVPEPDGLAVRGGPVLRRLMQGMRGAVAALAAAGNDLILDEVLTAPDQLDAYRAALAGCALHLVGLFAPLEVLEARERARGDRAIGLARWQVSRVHRGIAYDLQVDTSRDPPEACARRIAAEFGM